MKKWIVFCAAAIAIGIFVRLKPADVDVAALEPVELLYVVSQNGMYYLATDTGQQGSGKTVQLAISDLKRRSSGEIFLHTAQYLLISRSAWEAVERFSQHLRPDCSIIIAVGQPDMEAVSGFLRTHKPGFTLNDLRAGDTDVPFLYSDGGGMLLEKP